MTRDEAEQLLGGYATGTLTAEERRLLFEAALADQTLFNALAHEQALKELLDHPHARRRLLETLRARAARPSWLSRLREWCGPLVAVRAVAGGVAVALLAVTTVTRLLDVTPPPSEITEDSYQAESARDQARSVDKLTAKPQPAGAPKRSALRDQAPALEHARRESDLKQNRNDGERRAGAEAPQMETMRSGQSAMEAMEKKTTPGAKTETPAAQPPAKAAPAAPSADLLARADAARSAGPGARALFYEAKQKETAAALEPQSAESRPASGGALQERSAEAPVQRLGLRYGIVSREEGPALVIEVNQRGYLYATARDAAGTTILAYPLLANDPHAATVEPGARYVIPPLRAFPATKLTLILSRTPLADPTTPAAPKPSDKKDALLQRTMESLEGISGPTLYVVETAPSLSSTLSVEIVVPAR